MDKHDTHFELRAIAQEPFANIALVAEQGNLIPTAILPYHFIDFEKRVEAHKEAALFLDFIKHLSTTFSTIELKMPIQFTDARPFTWLGFKVVQHYTYLIDLQNASYVQSSLFRFETLAFNLENLALLKAYFDEQNIALATLQDMVQLATLLPYQISMQVLYNQNEIAFVHFYCTKQQDQTLYLLAGLSPLHAKNKDFAIQNVNQLIQHARTNYLHIDLGIGDSYEEMLFANHWQVQVVPYFVVKNK
jgi:hypothetical protein